MTHSTERAYPQSPLYYVTGDTRSWQIGIEDDDGTEIDVSAWTIEAQIRRTFDSATAIDLTITLSDGATTSNSFINWTVVSGDTVDQQPGWWVWGLRADQGDGPETILGGPVKVEKGPVQ